MEEAATGLTHLAFVQSLLDHVVCAACVAGREVLHMGTGVADRVKVIRWAGAGLHAAWKELQARLAAGGREGWQGYPDSPSLRTQAGPTSALSRAPLAREQWPEISITRVFFHCQGCP